MNKKELEIVVIGGGTGSFTLLSALKKYTSSLTAIVNMADDGGSTGVLRDELGVLPAGDVRQCLVALSESPKVRDLFNYRFDEGSLQGHAFGNLFLAALEKLTGNFAEAVETAAEVLRVQGRVVPATLDNVRLRMSWPDKDVVLSGERVIDVEQFKHDPRQATLSLEPRAKANPAALQAIADADIVVIAPGDLYTSLGPILVADGFAEALKNTKANVAYVCNLVTKRGQTDGFNVAAHAAEIERFVGEPIIDVLVYNTGEPQSVLLQKYANKGEFWVSAKPDELKKQHYKIVGDDFLAPMAAVKRAKSDPLAEHRTFIRHDADKVARALLQFAVAKSRSHQEVETLALFDLDRTLFDTEKFREALEAAAARHGLKLTGMEAERARVWATGRPFYDVEYIAQAFGPQAWNEVRRELLAAHGDNAFLYSDALEFLNLLEELHVPVAILTHGTDVGQRLKLELSPRLSGYPFIVTDSRQKGVLLGEVRQNGRYYITPDVAHHTAYAARRILFFDDVLENFAGLSAESNITAFYLVERSRSKGRAAELAIEPIHIRDLSEARSYLSDLLST